ncbi:Thioesterase/thiol ester dehydrase-isomerase [Acaromyces ingoldii]|uniref:Thioesterase/thiol ester dehydrase-isomerase n=1 Tax=Acaromyces ingoldii TaxID=215250 RepID=A0A316YVU8_9BASI|nr:Thioesterase/thiol ester dehydrase-isomerase [Acaromyces ingoldii]PWN93166.1 Thioesterase/thiol ester dehydrase-isomerase [Acaromyces ingoldii]
MSPPTACHRFVQRVTNAFLSAGGHDSSCLAQSSVRLIHAQPGLVRLGLTIGKHNVNRLGSLHGGLICTLTDTMGSLALASRGLYSTGVSTDISTTFVKAAGVVGDEVHAEGRVISLGKTLATTRMELRHPVTNAILAFGSHTKFVGKAHGHAENVEFDDQGNLIKGRNPDEWPDK